MMKVFLVEDEFVVREGIKNNVDWKKYGYDFCGDASDGELAFPMIQKLKPDIVITDIRMPFMDGLELSRLIKKEMPWIEIIILTGYQEFEYAKEGIKLGVAQYLSKPISSEELIAEVNILAAKIKEKRQKQEMAEMYMKETEENLLEERKELFNYLVTGGKSVTDLLELGNKLNMDLSAMWYGIVLMKVQSMLHEHGEYSNSLIEIEERIKTLEAERKVVTFDRNLEGKAILFKADSRDELEKQQTEYLQRVEEVLKEYDNIRYFGGIGEAVNRLRELPASFESASHAFAHRYLVEGNHILNIADMGRIAFRKEDDFRISDVDTKYIDRNRIREFLKLGDKGEVIYFVDEFFKSLGDGAMKSNIFRQYITMDIYFCVVDFVEGLLLQKEEIEAPDVSVGDLQSWENAIKYVVKIISKAVELREKVSSNRYGDVVEEVMHYIAKNYAEEDLSLNRLASHVNFSPNHLSMIFSQQTGHTLIKYLTDFRMSKAKELLRCTNKRSSVVALEVGYKDSHYFSYLFKKTQGMTPTQYRGGKASEGEE